MLNKKLVGFGWLFAGIFAAALAVAPAAPALAAEAANSAKPPVKTAAKAKAKRSTKAKAAGPRPVAGKGIVFRKVATRAVVPARPSFGHLSGLQNVDDALELKSSVALVVDQDTDEVLFSKNPGVVLPIASITKLMTAVVVTEAALPLDEVLTVVQDDVDATAGSRSRLKLGTRLTRGEMLHLALMSSENRAAHLLGRTYPGGMQPFVAAMNAKAMSLGMLDTRYVEPTGLSSDNQSSAQDLARLVRHAYQYPILRDLSTTVQASVPVGTRQVQFSTTNGLVRNPDWEIGLQKTGYISAAGRCLVMQAQLAGRKLIMVLLDSAGKYSRMGDAERIRKWLAAAPLLPAAVAAPLPPAELPGPQAAPGLAPAQLQAPR